jgi:hypothetical protein
VIKMRAWALPILVLLFGWGGTGCSSTCSSTPAVVRTAVATPSATSATTDSLNNVVVSGNSTVPAQAHWVNPGPACGSNGIVNGNPKVQILDRVSISLPGGGTFGTLLFMHSRLCNTTWSEVTFDEGRALDVQSVHVVANLAGPPFTDEYVSSVDQSPVFTYMHTDQTGGAAWVVIKAKSGKLAAGPQAGFAFNQNQTSSSIHS